MPLLDSSADITPYEASMSWCGEIIEVAWLGFGV